MNPDIMKRLAWLSFELGSLDSGEKFFGPGHVRDSEQDRRVAKATAVMIDEIASPNLGRALVDLAVALRPVSKILADEASALAQAVSQPTVQNGVTQ